MGRLQSRMHCILLASACIPQSSIIWPRHSNLFESRSTILLLRKRWWSLRHWNTIPRCFSCSSIERDYIKMLFRYTWMKWLMQSQKIAVISRWNVEGALQSPICITWLLNVPSTMANTILWMCSGTMCICSYASDILSFERYAALAISLWMISCSVNGVTSLTVLSFCSHRLKTVHSLPFFFSIQSIGTAWCATAGIHHCAVVYLSIFWESSLWNALGISAANSGYTFQDQLSWSHGSPPR